MKTDDWADAYVYLYGQSEIKALKKHAQKIPKVKMIAKPIF